MSNIDPNKIDDLFQKGVNHYEHAYNEEAWTQLEQRLDKDKRSIMFWRFAGMVGVLLLTLGYFYILTPTSEPKSESNIVKSQKANQKEKVNKISKETIVDLDTLNIENNTRQRNEELTGKNDLPTNPRNRIIHKPMSESTNIKESIDGVNNKIKRDDINIELSSVISAASPSDKVNDLDLPKGMNDKKEAFKLNKMTLMKSLPLYLTRLMADDKFYDQYVFTKSETHKNIETDKNNTEKSRRNHFRLGILLASDFTAVGLDNISKENWKGGLTLGYELNKNLSAEIGASYLIRHYETGRGEYIPPVGFWTTGVAPKSMEGVNNTLEMPLSLTFYPNGNMNKGLFAQVGVVSYLNLKQACNYSYDIPDENQRSFWQSDDPENNWFGILELNLGYTIKLNKKVSSKLGPYAHIPLKGIGHGQVKMWSLGLKLNLETSF